MTSVYDSGPGAVRLRSGSAYAGVDQGRGPGKMRLRVEQNRCRSKSRGGQMSFCSRAMKVDSKRRRGFKRGMISKTERAEETNIPRRVPCYWVPLVEVDQPEARATVVRPETDGGDETLVCGYS